MDATNVMLYVFFVYQYNYLILIQNTFRFANKFIKAINIYLSGDYIVQIARCVIFIGKYSISKIIFVYSFSDTIYS